MKVNLKFIQRKQAKLNNIKNLIFISIKNE